MKPSPAPWSEFETDDGDFGVKMDDAHSVIFGNLEGSCGICHANARLTSLAPELLERLRRAQKAMTNYQAYRRMNTLNFQLEKADSYIREISLALGDENDLPEFI